MDADEDVYHATPQVRGRNAHATIDSKTTTPSNDRLESLSVFSQELGVYGKIDVYNRVKTSLVERKYQLKHIYQGQIYQLWAQFFCMIEMGYSISKLAFYEISTRKTTYIEIPGIHEKKQLLSFVQQYNDFNPRDFKNTNINKCAHCVYLNLCDKTNAEQNVY